MGFDYLPWVFLIEWLHFLLQSSHILQSLNWSFDSVLFQAPLVGKISSQKKNIIKQPKYVYEYTMTVW